MLTPLNCPGAGDDGWRQLLSVGFASARRGGQAQNSPDRLAGKGRVEFSDARRLLGQARHTFGRVRPLFGVPLMLRFLHVFALDLGSRRREPWFTERELS
jgi:hypothetical protein